MRCAAHSLQLVDKAVIKSKECSRVIANVRRVVKKLRAQNVTVLLNERKIPRPMIDCATRWSSTFDMLQSFLVTELQDFCKNLAAANKIFYISGPTLEKIKEIVKVLQPSKTATVRMQSEQLTMGDFYGIWMQCKIDTNKISCAMSRRLISEMEKREKQLFTNEAFLAAIYLDLRYQIILSSNQKEQAVDTLT